ncbi:MAG: hypothetical protein QXL77_03840 [Candidatus Bathyarchaeia archaeon]
MRSVKDCTKIKRGRNESVEAYYMKILLCKLGKKLGFDVDVEEEQESELGKLAIRHDILWYIDYPEWFKKLLEIVSLRGDLDEEYRALIRCKLHLKRQLYAAFEIEATDATTKAMKGDISNLSKLPYGFIIVKRGKTEKEREGKEPIRNRFERALMEFRSLHGPNNVLIVSFEDIINLCKYYGVS